MSIYDINMTPADVEKLDSLFRENPFRLNPEIQGQVEHTVAANIRGTWTPVGIDYDPKYLVVKEEVIETLPPEIRAGLLSRLGSIASLEKTVKIIESGDDPDEF